MCQWICTYSQYTGMRYSLAPVQYDSNYCCSIRIRSQNQSFFMGYLVGPKEIANAIHSLGGGFQYFYFHPYSGKWSNLTNIFQRGWNPHTPQHLDRSICLGETSKISRSVVPQVSGTTKAPVWGQLWRNKISNKNDWFFVNARRNMSWSLKFGWFLLLWERNMFLF